MVTVAVFRAVGFSPLDTEEYIFYMVRRGPADFILLEEKNTDKRYRIEYDNHYRHTEDVVREIVEELRTRQFDILSGWHEDQQVNWNYYNRVVQEICELIEHGIETFELHGISVRRPAGSQRSGEVVVISLGTEIEAEFRFIGGKFAGDL